MSAEAFWRRLKAKEANFEEARNVLRVLIQSEALPKQRYVGFTTNLKNRIAAHNAGGSIHTSKFEPWKLISYHAFAEKRRRKNLSII